MKLVLLKEYRVTPEDKKRIQELDHLFIEGNQNYLNGKKLPESLRVEINNLWDKYQLHYIEYGFSNLIEIESREKFQGTNKIPWIKTYILSWLANMENELTFEKLWKTVTSREAYRVLLNKIYEEEL